MTAARADLHLADDVDDIDVPDDIPEPERWEPDAHLIDSVLATPKAWRGMLKQPEPDRSLLVAGLTLAGLTAKQIADRTTCSLRLIRFIRAKDMTQVCVWALETVGILEKQLHEERSDHSMTRQKLAEATSELKRLQKQFDQVVDARVGGEKVERFPRCNHAMTKYNRYEYAGKVKCRECRRMWEANKRKPRIRTKLTSVSVPQNGHPAGIADALQLSTVPV